MQSSRSGVLSGSGVSLFLGTRSVAIIIGSCFLVDRKVFRCCCRWTFNVACDFGRCMDTKSEVNQGQDAKFPELMDFTNVDTTGLNHDVCRYDTNSCIFW